MQVQWWCVAQSVPWTWEWRAYPGVWLFVAALAAGFVALRKRYGAAPTWPLVTGLVLLWAALDWPVGTLGAGYLASVHMVQFLLIAMIAPPLLLLGVPAAAYRSLDTRAGPVLRVFTHPLVTLGLFLVMISFTHWPPVVDAWMATQVGSFGLDLLWLVGGVIFWWPVVAPVPKRAWLQPPVKMGYLIVATLLNTGVFAYLTFSALPLYATYELAPPVGLLSTRDDQILAGLLMKVGGAVILWTAISILFFRWMGGWTGEEGSQARESAGRARSGASGALALAFLTALSWGCDAGDRADRAAGGTVYRAGDLEVADVVLAEPTGGQRTALYLTVRNRGDSADALVGAEVDGAGRASLHRTVEEGGRMGMRRTEEIVVPPGGEAGLRPGAYHIMVEGLSTTPAAGDSLRVVLRFRGGGRVDAWARVVPYTELPEIFP